MKTPKRFILVDDDAMSNVLSQELVRRVCGSAEVQLFSDPMKALAYLEQNYSSGEQDIPTILLLDIYTPVMTSWEFLERYKQLKSSVHRQVTIFIVSSSEEQKDIETAVANTFVAGHIIKPMSKAILKQVVSAR